MQCSGSQTLPAGGSSQNLHSQVTCKEGKRIIPAGREEIFKKTPFGGHSAKETPLQIPGAPRKERGMIFLSLQVTFPPAAGKEHGLVLLCCMLLMLLRNAGVSGRDPTSSGRTRSCPSTISPSSLCSSNIFGTVGGDCQPPALSRWREAPAQLGLRRRWIGIVLWSSWSFH